MKWRSGGFDNLRKSGKETGQGARTRARVAGKIYRPPLELCAKCFQPKWFHEKREGQLSADHEFQA